MKSILTALLLFICMLCVAATVVTAQEGVATDTVMTATEPAGNATGAVSPVPSPALPAPAFTGHIDSLPEPDGAEEKTAAVIKVDGLKVYVDAGTVQGVVDDTMFEVYRMDPIRDLQGEVLDHDRVTLGLLEVTEVRPRLAICRPSQLKQPPERGDFVRYFVSVDKPAQEAVSGGKCPPGMLYDAGGPFLFKAGSMFNSIPPSATMTEETEPFCIDKYPAVKMEPMSQARAICAQQGKRLCERTELQKVCAVWEKPKPCPPDVRETTGCPETNTVMDFRADMEWAYEMIDKDDLPYMDGYSCKCSGAMPVCAHCYYEECRGAKKIYRCCHDSYQE